MHAWWTRKSEPKPDKNKADSSDSLNANSNPKQGRPNKKEKPNSFDDALVMRRKTRDLSSPVNGCRSEPGPLYALGHPLPRPVSSPLPSIPHDLAVAGSGSASASGSVSSVSSSASDETPDLGGYRYSESINMPKGRNSTPESHRQQHRMNTVSEHPRCPDISVSPKKKFRMFGVEASSHPQTSMEKIFNSGNCTRGHPLPTSPIHPRAHGKSPGSPKLRQDDLKSPPQPLPLPPSLPGSSSSLRPVPSQWKKGKLLGRGTFGHVNLGFNSESGQMCAIKEVVVISDDSNSKECLRQLNQEITLLSQLSHPNIVQYYGSELGDDTLSVYLEYVSGGSIHKLLQEYGPFREPVIRNYTRQILSGLAYLHGGNTVHRDIKGANILVDPNGEVKLADFGMAKRISAYTYIQSFKGSPYWMAPEVIMNDNGYNLSVDIWSLGCTILEMATSKPPWSQFAGVPAMFKIVNSKDIPDIPDHLSSDAKGFLKLCLQRDPAVRPTAAQLIDHPFVRDQAWTKVTKSSMFQDMLPPLTDGNHRMATMDLSSNRSISSLCDRDYGVGPTVGFPSSSGNQSLRMNMSLPVSPCSSPLHQFKQYNRSCLPSPPHSPYTTGAINYRQNNYSLYPSIGINNFDPLIEIPQRKSQTTYSSPRKMMMIRTPLLYYCKNY